MAQAALCFLRFTEQGNKGSEPERDTVTWYQDFEKSKERTVLEKGSLISRGVSGQRWEAPPEPQLPALNGR